MYKNTEIALAAKCSEGAVRKAKVDGRIGNLEAVVAFVLSGRLKSAGIEFIDELVEAGHDAGHEELEYEPDREHEEGRW